jgi:hypothetical protein
LEPQYSRLSDRPERTRQAECLKKETWIYYYYTILFKVFIIYFPLSPVHNNNLEIPPPCFISIPIYSWAGAILICIKTHNIQNTRIVPRSDSGSLLSAPLVELSSEDERGEGMSNKKESGSERVQGREKRLTQKDT